MVPGNTALLFNMTSQQVPQLLILPLQSLDLVPKVQNNLNPGKIYTEIPGQGENGLQTLAASLII